MCGSHYIRHIGQYCSTVCSLLCGCYTLHLGLFTWGSQMSMCIFLKRELMTFIIFSKGHTDKEKLGTAVQFVDNSPELLLVVTWALLVVAWIWGIPFSGRLGETCSTSGIVRCIFGFSGWNPERMFPQKYFSRHQVLTILIVLDCRLT